MTFDGTVARLQFKSVRSEMSGSYKCVIVNEFGKEESTAQLSVSSNLTLIHSSYQSWSTDLWIFFHRERESQEGEGKIKTCN